MSCRQHTRPNSAWQHKRLLYITVANAFNICLDTGLDHWHTMNDTKAVVLKLGFANPQGFTGRFPKVLGWQLSFHVLLFFSILY